MMFDGETIAVIFVFTYLDLWFIFGWVVIGDTMDRLRRARVNEALLYYHKSTSDFWEDQFMRASKQGAYAEVS